jgi:acyl-CoA synthetase (NDP forming)
VSYVEDPRVCEFSKLGGDHPVSCDSLTRTTIHLVELVEDKIEEEMKDTPIGGLLHDD